MTFTQQQMVAVACSAVKELGAAFQRSANQLAANWREFSERCYLQHHSRLPGSDKTARLRKKRRDIVFRWVQKQVE